MTLNVESPRVYTRHGVPISVTGIAQVSQLECVLTVHRFQLCTCKAFSWGCSYKGKLSVV